MFPLQFNLKSRTSVEPTTVHSIETQEFSSRRCYTRSRHHCQRKHGSPFVIIITAMSHSVTTRFIISIGSIWLSPMHEQSCQAELQNSGLKNWWSDVLRNLSDVPSGDRTTWGEQTTKQPRALKSEQCSRTCTAVLTQTHDMLQGKQKPTHTI